MNDPPRSPRGGAGYTEAALVRGEGRTLVGSSIDDCSEWPVSEAAVAASVSLLGERPARAERISRLLWRISCDELHTWWSSMGER